MTTTSNIRVFVRWEDQSVFAGEDIECEITFKNVARNSPSSRRANALYPPSERQRKASPLSAPAPSLHLVEPQASRKAPAGRGHRSTLSLTVPASASHGHNQRGSPSWPGPMPPLEGKSHVRSVSIISIGASESAADGVSSQASVTDAPRRPARGHGRSASLQIIPRKFANGLEGMTGPNTSRSATMNSPLSNMYSPPLSSLRSEFTLPERPSRRHSAMSNGRTPPTVRSPPIPNFKFPATAENPSITSQPPPDDNPTEVQGLGIQSTVENKQLLSPRQREESSGAQDPLTPMAKILSPLSNSGTPRSSGEFYSLSNNSTETLMSEYLPQHTGRTPRRNGHSRKPSNLSATLDSTTSETLMMGFAQIHGTFTLDGSLMNQAPFEEVKRKGVVGQGGGVIGIETPNKRDSGLLRSFGWGSIGESLGGLLGGGELSTIKDMRQVASTKSVPLLSTPQSILFVNLQLAPGESKSYKYSFKIPKGLPPSYRGKAIKIAYNLVIGTQRPGGSREQQVKSVELPFRVLGSVNSYGEVLGHDLMSPYIILRDQAVVKSVEDMRLITKVAQRRGKKASISTIRGPSDGVDGFLEYADELLERPQRAAGAGLLSPTANAGSRRPSFLEEPSTAKEAIDMAILRSNVIGQSQQSANRFEIARSGQRVAVIMLARPAYRLGEVVMAALDFTNAEIPCYAIHASLEACEKIDPSIALRSEATIRRMTRKVHASSSESTLFARRITFSPTIPITATPDFVTSGISLEWKIRIEFVTPRLDPDTGMAVDFTPGLLEEISRDDRGAILAGVQNLECESFEIAVPLRVYGAAAGHLDKDADPVGLVV